MSGSGNDSRMYEYGNNEAILSSMDANYSMPVPKRGPGSLFVRPLCGVPGICKNTALSTCKYTSVRDCSECTEVASGLFVFFVLILGLSILVGNSLVIAVYFKLKRKRKATKADICKVSLAVADLIAGTTKSILCRLLYRYMHKM